MKRMISAEAKIHGINVAIDCKEKKKKRRQNRQIDYFILDIKSLLLTWILNFGP